MAVSGRLHTDGEMQEQIDALNTEKVDLVEQVQAVEDSIAPDYADLVFPVAAGQKCYHDSILYTAVQPIQTSEEWTAVHWKETTVDESLGEIISAVNEKADKTDTILETTLSRGRKANTTVGARSFAFGKDVEASKADAHAEGWNSVASGEGSHAEGRSIASGTFAHSEGEYTEANGHHSHAEGYYAVANGNSSHAEGDHTIAGGDYSHVFGAYNIEDSVSNWPEWTANTHYNVGDKVKKTSAQWTTGYICKTENTDSTFTGSKWNQVSGRADYVEIVGNGVSNARSNARTLDWNGNEELAGDLTVNKGTADEVSVSELKNAINQNDILETLRADDIPGTTQSIIFDQQTGDISQITHMANNTAVRTDVFTFGSGTITEVRTLSTGQSLTIVTDTTTLETTITYADAA